MIRYRNVLVPALVALAVVIGCEDDKDPIPPGDQIPDFSLTDVNPNSPTAGLSVSPRDHLGHVSAWYFGQAT